MVDNPTKIYNDYVRANLPNSMSYDTGTDRYDINNHSFFKFKNSNWYYNYISKYGYSALSAYAVNGFEPALVFDFKGNYFRKSATDSTFAASITHTASTNATMVDSDGLLKWRPHNILRYSEDLTNANWVKQVSATVDANVSAAPDGSMTASRLTFGGPFSNLRQIGAAVTGVTATTKVWIKLESGNANLSFGISSSQFDVITVTSEWVEYSTTDTENAANGKGFILQDRNSSGVGSVLIWQPQCFRSDLGGMVNNPDAATGFESYVPTTTTPVYLSRRGHHIYNGTAWVNEGILHESEARTNLCLHSNNSANWLSHPGGSFTLTAAQAVGSDGTSSLTKVAITDTVNEAHEAYTTYGSINPSLGLTLSADFKDGNQRFVMLREYISTYDWFAVVFDLVTGTVTQENVGSGSVTIRDTGVIDLSNGLYRCWVSYIDSFNTTAAGQPTVDAVSSGTPTLNSSGSESYSGVAGTHFFLGAIQLEAGSTPSSYIPTAGATVTRAAETLTVPAANLPYDNTNMSIQMDGKMTGDTLTPVQWLLDASNSILLESGSNNFSFTQKAVGTVDTVTGGSFTSGTNVPFNLASRHGSSFINGAVDGTALTANTTPTALPNLASSNLILGDTFMGTIGQFRMWSDDLTDAGIATATAPSTEPSLQLTFDGSSTSSFKVLDWSE